MTNEQTFFNKHKWLIYAVLITLFLSFLLNKCNNSAPAVAIIKEQKGTLRTNNVKNEPIEKNSLTVRNIRTVGIGKKLKVSNSTPLEKRQKLSRNDKSNDAFLQKQIDSLLKINKQLENDFASLSDSAKNSAYQKSIQLNKFSHSFEDKKIKINSFGVARGTVESMQLDYTIKEQQIPTKERVFVLRTGIEYGITPTFNNGLLKANIEVENRKGDVISYGYDTDKRHYLGYKIKIFEIKK